MTDGQSFYMTITLVGLSLDGTKDIHDMNRIDAATKGTFNRIMKLLICLINIRLNTIFS